MARNAPGEGRQLVGVRPTRVFAVARLRTVRPGAVSRVHLVFPTDEVGGTQTQKPAFVRYVSSLKQIPIFKRSATAEGMAF